MGATTTDVGICNSALVKIGSDTITSLSGTDKKSVICNIQYPLSRDYVLRAHPWRFAITRASLAMNATAPLYGFDNAFVLPTNCLRVLSTDQDPDVDWKIEGGNLLIDSSEAMIKYIMQMTDYTQFDSNFVEVLSWHIAWNICYAIVQSKDLATSMNQSYLAALKETRSYDSQQGTPDHLIADDLRDVRW